MKLKRVNIFPGVPQHTEKADLDPTVLNSPALSPLTHCCARRLAPVVS